MTEIVNWLSQGAVFLLSVGVPVILFFTVLVILTSLVDWLQEQRERR